MPDHAFVSGAAPPIRSITGRRGVRPRRARPWRDLERTLTGDPERLRRLLACPAHKLAAAVSAEPAGPMSSASEAFDTSSRRKMSLPV